MKKIFNKDFKFFLILFILVFSIVLYFTINNILFLNKSVEVYGEIVEVIIDRSDDPITQQPVYKFTDRNGNEHRIKATFSSNLTSHEVGDLVKINYDPQRPETAKIANFMDTWGVYLIGAFILAVIFVLSLNPEITHNLQIGKKKKSNE